MRLNSSLSKEVNILDSSSFSVYYLSGKLSREDQARYMQIRSSQSSPLLMKSNETVATIYEIIRNSFFLALILSPLPVSAEVGELKNPSWKEVPNTRSPNATEQFDEPAFVDINGIVQKGDIVIFDLVNTDASYDRVEANCRTNQFRSIRQGIFRSKTRINYTSRINTWSYARESYHQALMKFICSF